MLSLRPLARPALFLLPAATALLLVPTGPGSVQDQQLVATPPVAFSSTSWWNAPVPVNAPQNANAAAILNYMSTAEQSRGGCLRLGGAGTNAWGEPVFWAKSGDPTYSIRPTGYKLPPEFSSLRIPVNASAGVNSDAELVVFDEEKGYVAALHRATFDATRRSWSAAGGVVTYLASNGLHVRTQRSDDPRNVGSWRGNNGATMMARFDQVQAGAITNVLKIASGPEVSSRFTFPMVGSDGDYKGTSVAVPPQGLRFRIKPGVDLSTLNLAPQALIIARGLQNYGFYIGDSSGTTTLKLEDTRAQGRGQLWNVPATALCGLPLTPKFWDVLPEGYDPSR